MAYFEQLQRSEFEVGGVGDDEAVDHPEDAGVDCGVEGAPGTFALISDTKILTHPEPLEKLAR
jgi:hypothetical protein